MVYYNVVIEFQISQMCSFFSMGLQMVQHLHFHRIIPKLSTCLNCAKMLNIAMTCSKGCWLYSFKFK